MGAGHESIRGDVSVTAFGGGASGVLISGGSSSGTWITMAA